MFWRHPVVRLGMKSLLAYFLDWIYTAGSKASVTAHRSFHISELLEKLFN